MPSVMQRIRDAYPSLSSAKKTAASYFLNNFQSLTLSTVTELAEAIGVSDTTIINLCVDLGFSGFSSFKRQLRTEAQQTAEVNQLKAEPGNGGIMKIDALVGPLLENISATFSDPQNRSAIDQTVELLGHAETIYAIGFWAFAAIAQAFSVELRRNRWRAQAIYPDMGDYVDKVLQITPQDVAVLFDFSRYLTGLTEICLLLKERNVPIVLLTDLGPCPRHPYADITVHCHRNTLTNDSVLPTAMALAHVLTVLLKLRFPLDAAEYETLREGVFTRFNPYGVVEPDPRTPEERV